MSEKQRYTLEPSLRRGALEYIENTVDPNGEWVQHSDHLAHEAAAIETLDAEWFDKMVDLKGEHQSALNAKDRYYIEKLAALRRELTPREKVLRTYTQDTFTAIAESSEPIVVHRDFSEHFLRLCGIADKCGVELHVTHSLRRLNPKLEGAIVEQAERSNHHAGHAIDLNVVCEGEWFNSKRLASDALRELPESHPVRQFLMDVQCDPGLRWGGDFSTPDPVHFDNNLVGRDPEAWLRCVREIRDEQG